MLSEARGGWRPGSSTPCHGGPQACIVHQLMRIDTLVGVTQSRERPSSGSCGTEGAPDARQPREGRERSCTTGRWWCVHVVHGAVLSFHPCKPPIQLVKKTESDCHFRERDVVQYLVFGGHENPMAMFDVNALRPRLSPLPEEGQQAPPSTSRTPRVHHASVLLSITDTTLD
jgi:hypothetical protein